MAKMDPALPAVLYEAYRRSFVADDWLKEKFELPDFERQLSLLIGMPAWDVISHEERERWEAVAFEAVRFVTEEEVTV